MPNSNIEVLESQLTAAQDENAELADQVAHLNARVEFLTDTAESLLDMLTALQGAVTNMLQEIDPLFRSYALEDFARRQKEFRKLL